MIWLRPMVYMSYKAFLKVYVKTELMRAQRDTARGLRTFRVWTEVDEFSARNVSRDLQGLEREVNRALGRAVRKTTRWANTHAARGIAHRNQLPVGALLGRGRFKTKRLFMRMPNRRTGTAGSVWVGAKDYTVSNLGKVRQTRNGTRVGRHSFPGSFVATMRDGRLSSFQRASVLTHRSPRAWSPNLPVREDRIELQGVGEVTSDIQRKVGPRLNDLLQQELKYEINVRGRGYG